jgi:ElaB/YqjD/DUF883 family membrane-anchored ribosome-binding protein
MSNVTQKLLADVKILAADSEELAKATAAQVGEKTAELRNRIQQTVTDLKPRLAQVESMIKEKADMAATTTDEYVRAQPWTAIGIAAGAGLILGILIGRH